jgi:hypothetical protein
MSSVPPNEVDKIREVILKATEDQNFRRQLVNAPDDAIQASGVQLSKAAIDVIKSIDQNELDALASFAAKAKRSGYPIVKFF